MFSFMILMFLVITFKDFSILLIKLIFSFKFDQNL